MGLDPSVFRVYCCDMQDDPVRYWQDLTENYRQMSDGELLELAAKPEDLTDVAQQVLRDEMKLRRLTTKAPASATTASGMRHADIRWEPVSYRYEFADRKTDEDEGPYEYTWKTKLCDCETRLQAIQLGAALQRAGIDCWIQTSRTTAEVMDLTYPRILVAADQLEQAQTIAAQPIPQDIIDESQEEAESKPQYFEVPACPRCGMPDPVLCPAPNLKTGDPRPDDADWLNSWLCESCGAEWSDPEPGTNESRAADKSL